MQPITADNASIVRDFFLPLVEAEHTLTRLMIQSIPADRLDFQPHPNSLKLSDLAWYLATADHVALTAICDARLPDKPSKPDGYGVSEFVAWTDQRFEFDCKRLAALSGDSLVRPLEIVGTTRPAIEFLPVCLSNIVTFRSQLAMYLQLCGAAVATEAQGAGVESGELGESELAAVVGGELTLIDPSQLPSGPSVTMTTTQGYLENPAQTNATLGSLFQSQNQYGWAAGFAAIPGLAIGGIFGHLSLTVTMSMLQVVGFL